MVALKTWKTGVSQIQHAPQTKDHRMWELPNLVRSLLAALQSRNQSMHFNTIPMDILLIAMATSKPTNQIAGNWHEPKIQIREQHVRYNGQQIARLKLVPILTKQYFWKNGFTNGCTH